MFLFGNSNFLQALGWAVVNSLWQTAFLWVIFQTVLSFGFNKPSLKSKLATIFLFASFGWFLYTLIAYSEGAKTPLLVIASINSGYGGWNTELQSLLPYASLAYLLLLVVPTIKFIRNYRFVQLIRNSGLSKCNIDLRLFVQRFGERMGIRKPVHVYISELITSPVTIGYLKPIILMPIGAITNLTVKQVEAVLLHELAHIRRHDYFINLLINFIGTILYFNPFIKLLAKTIEREREKSCDEMVMQFEYDPHGYASALLTLERTNFMRQSIAIAAAGQKNDLLHRIEKILGIEKRTSPDFRKLAGLMAGLVCIIALNALFFLSSPTVQNHSLAFSALSNPFYELVANEKEPAVERPIEKTQHLTLAQVEVPRAVKAVYVQKTPRTVVEVKVVPEGRYVYSAPEAANEYSFVDEKMHFEQKLKKSEVTQVKIALAATKKVLEQGQWKQVEKNVADALTQEEKADLKEQYLTQVEKINWPKLEEKLRLSYAEINWNKVNAQLNTALTNITLDSLTMVYNQALSDLNSAKTWMTENKVQSIPDTDLKLYEVEAQKNAVQKQLETIKGIKAKTIIHL